MITQTFSMHVLASVKSTSKANNKQKISLLLLFLELGHTSLCLQCLITNINNDKNKTKHVFISFSYSFIKFCDNLIRRKTSQFVFSLLFVFIFYFYLLNKVISVAFFFSLLLLKFLFHTKI